MKYTCDKHEGYAVLVLNEENLNSVKAPELKSELVVLKNAGIKNLILNLEHVKFIDSSGLSAILTGNRLWEESGNMFVLTGVTHPSVKMLITISRLDSVLKILPDMKAAEGLMRMESLKDAIANPEEGDNVEGGDDLVQ